MGEYAQYKGNKIKIGTCETMYYLRYEDRGKVIPISGSLNPAETSNLFWRLPWPEEDACGPGGYADTGKGLLLIGFADSTTVNNPGTLQLKHSCGMLLNVTCYHGQKLPAETSEIRPYWNGSDPNPYELFFVRNTIRGILPVVRCKFCAQAWLYSWAAITPYISNSTMFEKLEQYFPPEDAVVAVSLGLVVT